MARPLFIFCVVCGLLAGCGSQNKERADEQSASASVQAQPTPDNLTTGGLDLTPEPASSALPQPAPTAPTPPTGQPPENPEAALPPEAEAEQTAPVQPVRVNILLTIDRGMDGNYVARFGGDFFTRILKAMHADLSEIPPLELVDGKPAKYNVSVGRSQLILQVRADSTPNAQQALVSYRVTLLRPSQTGAVFQREGENLVWTLGETKAVMGKLPGASSKGNNP